MMLYEKKNIIMNGIMSPATKTIESCDSQQWILPPAEQFPNRPILVKEGKNIIKIHDPSPPSSSSSISNDSHDISEYCTPIPINTDTFVGVAYLLIAGIPGSPAVFFEERQRRYIVYITLSSLLPTSSLIYSLTVSLHTKIASYSTR